MAKLARLARHYARKLKDVTSIPAQGRGLIFRRVSKKGALASTTTTASKNPSFSSLALSGVSDRWALWEWKEEGWYYFIHKLRKSPRKRSDVSQGDGNLLEKFLNLKYANILWQKLKNNEKSKVTFTQYDFRNCFCQC